MKKDQKMNDKLSPINEQNGIKLNILMELMYRFIETFCEYINDSPQENRIEKEKYINFVLYAMGERLKDDIEKKKSK